MDQAFRNLHRAAIEMATHLFAGVDQDKLGPVEAAVAGGANLVIEIGPLPDPLRVQLVLVEVEGRRQVVCTVGAQRGSLQ